MVLTGMGAVVVSGMTPDTRITATKGLKHMLPIEDWTGWKVPEGFPLEGRENVCRERLHDGIQAGLKEKGN